MTAPLRKGAARESRREGRAMPFVASEIEEGVFIIRWQPVAPRRRFQVPMLERAGRETLEWITALRVLGEAERASFRSIAIRRDDLWAVVEGRGAGYVERAAAAIALAASGAEEELPRLRAARDRCAFAPLRKLMDWVLEGDDDDAIATALARLEKVADEERLHPSSGRAA